MPAAVMTSGTIIGEIRRPMMKARNGICGRASPRAATVPSAVARTVAQTAMNSELAIDRRQISRLRKSSYQRREKASFSSASISSVKVK